ncbi:ADP-sugar pyrophosphatase-like [Oopsacas minuta]|uniref:ADP-sugar pyrophosphatase-like n=1 Tax=Oopsacas minuta TaxID=111878 RepID=A0AAV7JTP2_9METZ|nr:ADP-sugar pyrophosphatase-like [Oopsacas minuta]
MASSDNLTVSDQLEMITSKYKSMKSLNCEWKFVGDWLKFGIQHYSDITGTERTYELVQRTTRTHSKGVDGVDTIAIRTNPDGQKTIILVAVYRAPVGKLVLEFPAGLVDKGEELEQSAHRELKEETGESGKIIAKSKPTFADPWKSDETSVAFTMELNDSKKGTSTKLDEDEFLSKLEVPFDNLLATLEMAQDKFDLGVESKLYTFALGLQLAKS